MLSGYDSIKNLNSVSATPQLLLEWNANKFGNAIVAGTSSYPGNAVLNTQYLFNNGTTYNRDNTTANDFTTTVSTYTSTAYSNIISGGKNSIFSDSIFQVITANNAVSGTSGFDSPIDVSKVFDISQLFTGVGGYQQNYGLKISFWVKTTYSATKSNVTPDLNIFVRADIASSNSTTANSVTNSKTEIVTSRVNSARWTQVVVDFTPEIGAIANIQFLRLNIKSESFLDSYPEIAIDDIQVFRITKRQSKKTDLYNEVAPLFQVNRPGEYLVRYDEDAVSVQEGQSCHSTPLDIGFGLGVSNQSDIDQTKAVLYDDMYITNENFASYITSTYADDQVMPLGGSDKIWSLYEREFPVNKIVIKQNNNLSYCSSNVYVLTKNGSNFTWALAGTVTPNWNGVDILYYNGSTWSTTKWTTRPNISSGSISTYLNICGVYIERSTVPTAGNAWINTGIFNNLKAKLQFVEISPRLQIDVSDFLQSYKIVKEMSSDDDPLPIGQATSNNLSLTMSNLPIVKNTPDAPLYTTSDDIIIFNNESVTSPVTTLLQKDCQCFLYLNVNGTTIPQFTGYINNWSINENDANAQAYDIIKIFQDRNLSATKMTINDCMVNFAVELTLRNAGINDFNLASLKNLKFNSQTYKSKNIKYYWMEKDEPASDALDDLAKVYQMIIYADEYGKIIINSLSNIINSSTVSASIMDVSSNTTLSNIIGVTEVTNPAPKTFAINYMIASPPTINTGSIFLNNRVPIWQPESDVIALSNVELAQPLNKGDSSMYLTDISTFFNGLYDYEGYFIIDREIIYYNGIEHNIFYKTAISGAWLPYGDGKITVYSPENLKYYEDLLLSTTNAVAISIKPNSVLKNLQRGVFGTVETDHGIGVPLPSRTGMWDVTGQFEVYKNNFYLSRWNGNTIQYIKNGLSTGAVYIPPNQALYADYNFSTSNWNYFRTLQKMNNKLDVNAAYTGVFLSGTTANSGLFIGVGRRASGTTLQSIIVKPIESLNKQAFELNENDFGTEFINPSGSLSEAIKFEVFLRNYGTGTNNAAKIYINDTLISSSIVFQLNNASNPMASVVKFTNDDYLILYDNKTTGFGVFTYSGAAGTVGTELYELSFSGQTDKINYTGTNQDTITEETNLIENILNNLDTNGLTKSFSTPSYFYWTGTKNARQMKIFDIDLDQIPIQVGYSKLFTGSFSYEITALKNNYI